MGDNGDGQDEGRRQRAVLMDKAEALITKANATIEGIAALEMRLVLMEGQQDRLRSYLDREINDLKTEQIADLREAVRKEATAKGEIWGEMRRLGTESGTLGKELARIQAGAYVFYATLMMAGATAGFFFSAIFKLVK